MFYSYVDILTEGSQQVHYGTRNPNGAECDCLSCSSLCYGKLTITERNASFSADGFAGADVGYPIFGETHFGKVYLFNSVHIFFLGRFPLILQPVQGGAPVIWVCRYIELQLRPFYYSYKYNHIDGLPSGNLT